MNAQTARDLIPAAARRFGAAVHDVPDDAWSRRTPATEWTVRDLVGHLVSEHCWAPRLLRGETIDEVGSACDGDLLGDDPVGRWDATIADSLDAWGEVSGETPVSLSAGETPAEEYANQMLMDLTVHAWDLARGAGLDEELDAETVGFVLGYVEANESMLATSGLFGDPVEIDSDDPQDRLLALLGRDPR